MDAAARLRIMAQLEHATDGQLRSFFVAVDLGDAYADPGPRSRKAARIAAAISVADRLGRADDVLVTASHHFVVGPAGRGERASGRPSGGPARPTDRAKNHGGDRPRESGLLRTSLILSIPVSMVILVAFVIDHSGPGELFDWSPGRPSPTVMSVEIEAAQESGESVVAVEKGDAISITASGSWCMGGIGPSAECGGPAGIRSANRKEADISLPSAPFGELIGRIGDGPWFTVGTSITFQADRSGPLVLGFNDRSGPGYLDNSGTIKASVSISR